MSKPLKTYVIHVKTDVERERYILDQLSGLDLDIEFVLEGDIPDLDIATLSEYFEGDQLSLVPRTSCGFKHFKCYEYMIKQGTPHALVLEGRVLEKIRGRLIGVDMGQMHRRTAPAGDGHGKRQSVLAEFGTVQSDEEMIPHMSPPRSIERPGNRSG